MCFLVPVQCKLKPESSCSVELCWALVCQDAQENHAARWKYHTLHLPTGLVEMAFGQACRAVLF